MEQNKRHSETGMYIIDKEYRILNFNRTMGEMYPEVKAGDICYRALALNDAPCATCPLVTNDVLFYNPVRKEWISANAAEMDYPGHGECYNVQFKMRKNLGGTKGEIIRMELVDEHLAELKSATGTENIIGAYCAPGSPIFFANENMVDFLGYTSLDELVDGTNGMIVNMVHPDDRARVSAELLSRQGVGNTFETIFRIPRKDGVWMWTAIRGKFIETATGKLATIAVCDNIDGLLKLHESLNQQNQELMQKEQQTESMINKIPGCYHRCAAEEGYPFLYISESFEESVGWTKEEIEQQFDNKFVNLIYPEDVYLFDGLLDQIAAKGQGSSIYRIKKKDGGYRWVQDSTMYIEDGKNSYYQCTLADITEFAEQREQLALLRQKETQFEAIVQNIPGGFHRCAAKTGCPFLYVGEHFEEIVGYTKEELVTKFDNLYANLIWPEDSDAMEAYETMLQMKGKGNSYDTRIYRVKHKNGGYRWVTDSTMFVDMGEDSFFQGTIADITPYIEELEIAKERAEASNRAKSTFLFNASHDIRTPMNAIQGFTQILKQNADNEEKVRDVVNKMEKSSDTLMKLLNDVLELSRIESGKDFISLSVVDLEEHSNQLVTVFAEEIEQAGISLKQEIHLDNKEVWCDELKLTQIAMNMISNAKKFTPAGGTITLGVEQISDSDAEYAYYRFYVKDTGIGMSEEFQNRAFEQFERERTATESGVLGSGLGLSIIKKLTELMDGTCTLKSDLGKGTEIAAIIKCRIVNEHVQMQKTDGCQQVKFTGKRVLMVEDNGFNREIARFVLENMGILVEEAENGYVALQMLLAAKAGYYDLVLMDIQMPVMDGYTATKEIRCISNPAIASIPIIAMTANAFTEDRDKCLKAGMNQHLGKPVDAKELMRVMAEFL